jgi:hypothetical protein
VEQPWRPTAQGDQLGHRGDVDHGQHEAGHGRRRVFGDRRQPEVGRHEGQLERKPGQQQRQNEAGRAAVHRHDAGNEERRRQRDGHQVGPAGAPPGLCAVDRHERHERRRLKSRDVAQLARNRQGREAEPAGNDEQPNPPSQRRCRQRDKHQRNERQPQRRQKRPAVGHRDAQRALASRSGRKAEQRADTEHQGRQNHECVPLKPNT